VSLANAAGGGAVATLWVPPAHRADEPVDAATGEPAGGEPAQRDAVTATSAIDPR
jgi:hypothetical protein